MAEDLGHGHGSTRVDRAQPKGYGGNLLCSALPFPWPRTILRVSSGLTTSFAAGRGQSTITSRSTSPTWRCGTATSLHKVLPTSCCRSRTGGQKPALSATSQLGAQAGRRTSRVSGPCCLGPVVTSPDTAPYDLGGRHWAGPRRGRSNQAG